MTYSTVETIMLQSVTVCTSKVLKLANIEEISNHNPHHHTPT